MRLELEYAYNPEKNAKLKEERGISFEEIIYYINSGYLLDIVQHSNEAKYAGQEFYVVNVDDYVYLVPFVREGSTIFLKTIFPSRKHTKQYLKEISSRRR